MGHFGLWGGAGTEVRLGWLRARGQIRRRQGLWEDQLCTELNFKMVPRAMALCGWRMGWPEWSRVVGRQASIPAPAQCWHVFHAAERGVNPKFTLQGMEPPGLHCVWAGISPLAQETWPEGQGEGGPGGSTPADWSCQLQSHKSCPGPGWQSINMKDFIALYNLPVLYGDSR